jgi:predicted enzyme related to lactoylglutathione lyase
MTESQAPEPGQIIWVDLTIPDAAPIRDFYSQLVGWQPEPVEMGGYSDFNMTLADSGTPAAGICYARGENANLPPQWLMYIAVEDLAKTMETCISLGGKLVAGPVTMPEHRYCVVQDPAGAVVALVEVTS